MPLDGRDYGTQAFIPPMTAHPHARAFGDALAGALVASYSHLRTNATLVGHTAFPVRIRTFGSFVVGPSTWARIAQHVVALPYVATHLFACVATHCEPATLRVRVTCNDGTDTDGDGVNDYAATTVEAPSGERPLTYFTNAHPDDPNFVELWVALELTATVVSSGTASRTITVEGYALDTDGNPVTWAPQLVSVFWAAVG